MYILLCGCYIAVFDWQGILAVCFLLQVKRNHAQIYFWSLEMTRVLFQCKCILNTWCLFKSLSTTSNGNSCTLSAPWGKINDRTKNLLKTDQMNQFA